MAHTIEIKNIKTIGSSVDLNLSKEEPPIEVTEFSQQSLVCQLPKSSLLAGNLVTLTSVIHLAQEKIPFDITGVVLAVEEIPQTNLKRIKIQLRQYNKKLWQQFLDSSLAGQSRVDTLLAAMKGNGG
jgi:hypothetical protein